jgi:hypothetical protein
MLIIGRDVRPNWAAMAGGRDQLFGRTMPNSTNSILVIDDEPQIRRFVAAGWNCMALRSNKPTAAWLGSILPPAYIPM